MYNNKRNNDSYTGDVGNLSTLLILVAGLGIVAILSIFAISGVALEKGKSTSECISDMSGFKSGSSNKENCELNHHGSGEKTLRDNFGNPTPGLKSDTNLQDYTVTEKRIAKDIKKFSLKVEKFKDKHGRYPYNHELIELNYSADKEAYPGFYSWNLEYCTSTSGSEYIIVANSWDNAILYVSSNNKQPGKYSVIGDPHAATGGNGYPSPCYRGTSYSAADRIGLKEVGKANQYSNKVVEEPKSEAAKKGTQWADWAQ